MQAVILAAGLGQRLGELTNDRPKALVRVGGRELILRTLDFLDNPEISEIIVVTGFQSGVLEKFLKAQGRNIKTVHNPHFKDGSIRTIETALPFVKGDFLLMNTDHIYPKRMLKTILEKKNGITAICDFDRQLGPDDMKVKLGSDGKLMFIRKTLNDFDCGYIGMTCCSKDMLEIYRDGVKNTREEEGNTASVEFTLGNLAKNNINADICDVSGIGWLEVDTQEDLMLAEKTLNQNAGFLL